MNDQELTKYSGEHLLYEFRMFWWLTGAVSYMDGYMRDALLEAWLVHLRNLINFFCSKGSQDDVIAAHFFDNPNAWSKPESDTLDKALYRANKELSHITAKRRYKGEEDTDWKIGPLFDQIRNIAMKFAKDASGAKLHPDVKRLLDASHPEGMVAFGGVSLSTNSAPRPQTLLPLSRWRNTP